MGLGDWEWTLRSDGAAAAAAATKASVLDQWREEMAALPRRKRGKWHGFLSDKWQVRQRVRYVGEIRHVDEGVPYEFEVYEQPNRYGGAGWRPVVDHDAVRATRPCKALSECARLMQEEKADSWRAFFEYQDASKSNAKAAPTPSQALLRALSVAPAQVRSCFEKAKADFASEPG